MKVYGRHNIFSGDIISTGAEDPNISQNILAVDKLSEHDTSGVDTEISIIDKDTHSLAVFSEADGVWKDTIDTGEPVDTELIYDLTINDTLMRVFSNSNDTNYIAIENTLFNFGNDKFVIDFYIHNPDIDTFGTLLYNGKNVGQVDLDVNKNFLLTTSGSTLIKDPNYQSNPTVSHNAGDNGYVVCRRPYLKSKFKLDQYHSYHIAIIRSNDTTYLAINGIIHDSAPSVDYFYYDEVKVDTGYYQSGTKNHIIDRLRVTKGTDLGWTKRFTPPEYEDIDGCDFVLDSTSSVDIKGNYGVTTIGSPVGSTVNWPIPEFIHQKYRKIHVNLTKQESPTCDWANLILLEEPCLQDVTITCDNTIQYYRLQSGYTVGDINESVFNHGGDVCMIVNQYNLPLTMRRTTDGWKQFRDLKHDDEYEHRLIGPHPIYDSGQNRDPNVLESNFYRMPYVIDSRSSGNRTTLNISDFKSQLVLTEDVSSLDLSERSSSVSILNRNTSQHANARIDMIVKFNSNPSANTNFYYINNSYTGWRYNQVNTGRQIQFTMGQYENRYGQSWLIGGWTASLPLNQWCLVSIRFTGGAVNIGTGYGRIYSYVRNLETDTVIQNDALIASRGYDAGRVYVYRFFASNYYYYYTTYSYSTGIASFNPNCPISVLGYRRDDVSSGRSNKFPRTLSEFLS